MVGARKTLHSILAIMSASAAIGCAADWPPDEDQDDDQKSVRACNHPDWQQGRSYRTGDVVKYTDGKYYVAEHDNPGYNPTVSTWYWDPHAGCDGTGNGGGNGSGARFSGFASYNYYDDVPAWATYCNLDPAIYGYQVTALRTDIQNRVRACGKCAKVTSKRQGGGNGKTIVVRIIDNSNDYTNNGGRRLLDLSPQAFQKIGDMNRGFIPVDFEITNCR